VLVRAEELETWHGAIYPETAMGWERWTTQPVDLRTIPTEHLELFSDANQELMAKHVREVIEAVCGLADVRSR
jgi:thioesterase domain-containing protein